MSLLQARPYQTEAVEAAFAAWRRGVRRPAEDLPTGAGKTIVFAKITVQWLSENPGRRVLILAHTTELCDQAMAKLASVAPGLRVGRVQADRNETLPMVVVASVATLRSENRRRMLRNVGLVIVDECHHAVAVTYRTIMNHYGCFGGENKSGGESAVALGVTATMMRGDDLALGDVWQEIVYRRTIGDLINGYRDRAGVQQRGGYLVRPRGLHVRVDDLDLTRVKQSRGDYQDGALGEAIEASMAPVAIAKAIAEHAPERKILLFAPTVHSSEVIADAVSASGRPAGLIHGGMRPEPRQRVLDDFRADSRGVLAGCTVLAEGFDDPEVSCVTLARPTRSPVLYRQMIGRCVRPYPGKTDALVLDLVGASRTHSLVGGPDLFGTKRVETDTDQDQTDTFVDEFEFDDELGGERETSAAGAGRPEDEGVDGPLVATPVDLFGASPMSWLRTYAGVYFLHVGERYVAIVPAASGNGFDVNAIHETRMEATWIEREIPDLSYAMAWAEQSVTPAEKSAATRGRAWAAKRPSEAMLRQCERWRLIVSSDAGHGEVSNMLTVARASQRIDPYIPAYARGR